MIISLQISLLNKLNFDKHNSTSVRLVSQHSLAVYHCCILLSSHSFHGYQLKYWSPSSSHTDLYIALQTIRPRHSSQCVSELAMKVRYCNEKRSSDNSMSVFKSAGSADVT